MDKKSWLSVVVSVHPTVFSAAEVRALCRTVMFLCTDLGKLCLYGTCFVHRHTVWKMECFVPRSKSSVWDNVHCRNVEYQFSINYACNAIALF